MELIGLLIFLNRHEIKYRQIDCELQNIKVHKDDLYKLYELIFNIPDDGTFGMRIFFYRGWSFYC